MAVLGNKYALGNTGGRPAKYDTAEELMAAVIDFFDYCNTNTVKATITGLALYLGFETRQSFYDYGDKSEFSYIIKRARLAIENSYELSGQTIDIFALKNMGWKDKTEIDQRVEQVKPFSWFVSQDHIMTTNGQEKES